MVCFDKDTEQIISGNVGDSVSVMRSSQKFQFGFTNTVQWNQIPDDLHLRHYAAQNAIFAKGLANNNALSTDLFLRVPYPKI